MGGTFEFLAEGEGRRFPQKVLQGEKKKAGANFRKNRECKMKLENVLKKVAAVLKREDIPYAFIGGVAVSYYAVPRATYDIDAVILVEKRKTLDDLIEKLKKADLRPQKKLKKISGLSFFTARAGKILVDLFLAEGEFLRSVLKRKKRVKLLGDFFYFASPEDLIILKLLSGRGRDVDDARELLSRKIDLGYVSSWCRKLGTESFLKDELASLKIAGGKK